MFGWMLRSKRVAVILLIVCPITYLLAVRLEMLLPLGNIVAILTDYPPGHVLFLQAKDAAEQLATWVIHGTMMGGVLCFVDYACL